MYLSTLDVGTVEADGGSGRLRLGGGAPLMISLSLASLAMLAVDGAEAEVAGGA